MLATFKPWLSGSTAILLSQRKHSTPIMLTFNSRFLKRKTVIPGDSKKCDVLKKKRPQLEWLGDEWHSRRRIMSDSWYSPREFVVFWGPFESGVIQIISNKVCLQDAHQNKKKKYLKATNEDRKRCCKATTWGQQSDCFYQLTGSSLHLWQIGH